MTQSYVTTVNIKLRNGPKMERERECFSQKRRSNRVLRDDRRSSEGIIFSLGIIFEICLTAADKVVVYVEVS